jgi:SAM-dependent methyltransferase
MDNSIQDQGSIINRFKMFVFRNIKPIESTFAYNRIRRDKWMKNRASTIGADLQILDIGAGGCPYKELFSHCDYFTQDFVQLTSAQIQDKAGYGKIDYVSDILDIPVPDNSFDVIICTEVIEHVPDPISVIKEVSRILKPGGTLLITAPLQSGLHQEPYHFYGGFTKYWYLKFLSESNFSDINIEVNGSLFTTYFALGLNIFRLLLDSLINDKNVFRKIVALSSLVICAPILLILNPVFGFLWEGIIKENKFTSGYHVSAKKSL